MSPFSRSAASQPVFIFLSFSLYLIWPLGIFWSVLELKYEQKPGSYFRVPWDPLYSFARAAMPCTTEWAASATEMYFLSVLEARSLRSTVSRIDLFWGVSPWLVDGHLLAVASHDLPSACIWVLISFLYMAARLDCGPLIGLHFTLMTSLKALSPNTVTFWGIEG